jgi:hypothetical protein
VKVGIVLVKYLGEHVLDLDVIIRAREAQAGGSFERGPRYIIQSSNK